MSVIIAVSCALSSWLKSCDRDIIQSCQELTISTSSELSVEIRWSIVGILHPALTVTDCLDLMMIGNSVPALGQTWFMAMVPTE